MTTNDQPSLEVQKQIIEQERTGFINGRYLLQMRMQAVSRLIEKKILDEEAKKPILDELTKTEAWITEYDSQLAEINAALKAKES